MNNLKELHQVASTHMQNALVAQGRGLIPESLRLFELAFEAEKQAALSLWNDFNEEPTRSILFRSAAALALDCKKYEEAKKMVYLGLAGNPPEFIAEELKEVYEQVYQDMKLVEEQLSEKYDETPLPSAEYFWLKGTLKEANARRHQITIVSEDKKTAKVNVPKGLSHIVRRFWDETVSAYILKQGKQLTLVEISNGLTPKMAHSM